MVLSFFALISSIYHAIPQLQIVSTMSLFTSFQRSKMSKSLLDVAMDMLHVLPGQLDSQVVIGGIFVKAPRMPCIAFTQFSIILVHKYRDR
jgi:hypothetical protein